MQLIDGIEFEVELFNLRIVALAVLATHDDRDLGHAVVYDLLNYVESLDLEAVASFMVDEVVVEPVPSLLKCVKLRSDVLLLGCGNSDVQDEVLVLGHLEGNEFSQSKQLRLKWET